MDGFIKELLFDKIKMIKIIKDYRFVLIKLSKRGQALYFPHSNQGFVEAFYDEEKLKERRGDSFYFKFEGLSRRLAEKVEKLVKNVDYTGVFWTDKTRLEAVIQQNL